MKRPVKARKQRKMRSKYPISKGLGGVPDVASLTETIAVRIPAGPTYTTNQAYRLYNTSLSLCPRACLVAPAYQEFRIRRISLGYKTSFDTFAGGGYCVPQLYYMIDKKGAVPASFDQETLLGMGAKPCRFDDKLKVIRWSPAVLQASLTDPGALTTGVASAQITPWLPTNNSPGAVGFVPSDVDHFGLSWIVYVPPGNSNIQYDIDIFVDIEFRKPRFNAPAVPPPAALDALKFT